jgi:hypothetical protein
LFLLLSFLPIFPDVDMPEKDRGLLSIEYDQFPGSEVASKPETLDHTTEYIGIITDLEDQVRVLKQQIMTAMDQAEKFAALS